MKTANIKFIISNPIKMYQIIRAIPCLTEHPFPHRIISGNSNVKFVYSTPKKGFSYFTMPTKTAGKFFIRNLWQPDFSSCHLPYLLSPLSFHKDKILSNYYSVEHIAFEESLLPSVVLQLNLLLL